MSACQAVTTHCFSSVALLRTAVDFSTTVNANIQAEKSETLFKMCREDKRSIAWERPELLKISLACLRAYSESTQSVTNCEEMFRTILFYFSCEHSWEEALLFLLWPGCWVYEMLVSIKHLQLAAHGAQSDLDFFFSYISICICWFLMRLRT